MRQLDNETKEIINSFVSEGYDLLEQAESKIAAIDSEEQNEVINTVFRLFHSIKGSAGYLNFNNIRQVTHEAENLLDLFRKKGKNPSAAEVDVIYQAMDFLRQLIESVEKSLSDEGFEEEAQLFVRDIKDCLANVEKDMKDMPDQDVFQTTPPVFENSTPNADERQVQAETEKVPEKKQEEDNLDELITPKMIEGFVHESAELLDKCEKTVLLLEKDKENREYLDEVFRNIHTLKGNAGFFGYEEIERETMLLESVLDDIRKHKRQFHPNMFNVILDHMDFVGALVQKIREGQEQKNQSKNSEIFFHPNAAPEEKTVEKKEIKVKNPNHKKESNPDFASKYKQLGEILVEMGATTQEKLEKALEQQSKPLGQILLDTGDITEEKLEKALEMQKKTAGDSMMSLQAGRKEIRVNTAKLDKLFDLVGELIVAQTMVFNTMESNDANRINFNKAFNSMNKITRELQEITMMVRMIPLDGLFNKMTRLVRDLSKKSEKKVNLTLSGQETEMDKNVIEQISDPLVHIIRNAIDHGIENKAVRTEAGKKEEGSLSLSAKYEGNEIWVSIKDDGRGLNREKIVSKAIERGLTTEEAAKKMSNNDIWQFIFEPGFSTADKVTEVSGRGVGMDVVKKNLEKIRGKIDIKTVPGNGSEFIMKIPLTMAIIDAITVRTGDNFFSIPLMDILEFFKVKEGQVTETTMGTKVLKLRNQLLTIISLYDVFKVKNAKKDFTEGIMLLVQNDNRKACLFIDEIIGAQQIVIKALPEQMGKIEGLSGCSVMGNGGVSFIIDTGGLFTKCLD